MKLKKSVKRKILKFILFILTITFLLMLGYCIYKIAFWWSENKKSNDIKKILSNYVIINENNDDYQIDFKKLKVYNSDVVGYLIVPNTKIDYPVVKYSDNDYYLSHSFDKTRNSAGWVFANYLNVFDGDDKNIAIFGHARLDGSMFGTLKDTLTTSWQSKKDKRIIFATEQGIDYYEVFSTYKILVEDYYIQNEFKNAEDFATFLDIITKRSNYDYGIDLTYEDQIITLSTCDVNNHYRIVLHAKRVTDDALID